LRYFKREKKFIRFTRSQEYKKNDNAHIEQKNYSIIRQYIGYERFEDPIVVQKLNELYLNEFYYFQNFFMVNFKLVKKSREGSKIKKVHDVPKTPFHRLFSSKHISEKTKKSLSIIFKKLNPFELENSINKKIMEIQKYAVLKKRNLTS
jgi:hypothetical protein